jgi:DNA modification methylase
MSIVHADDWLTVHSGDCRAVLATMPERSVHCVVTSPPYWGLRDYGHGDQLGLEPTPEAYVANMVAVFREVRRVMRDDATLWLNLGDTYSTAGGAGEQGMGAMGGRRVSDHRVPRSRSGLKPKDLVGIPWRVAFALQADGWYLRSDIIWAKPNPMPESVTDRPTKSHEYLFLLAKSERYYFDADAVREPVAEATVDRFRYSHQYATRAHREGATPQTGGIRPDALEPAPSGRNVRTVWTIATQPYPGAHFATFPPKLVEPCILAGTSERGVCAECGSPWRRVVERSDDSELRSHGTHPGGKHLQSPASRLNSGTAEQYHANRAKTTTTGWEPTCDHDATTVPATVLDCFGGSGTTAMVAQHLSRRAVLIDLNPDYIRQQLERNALMPLGLEAA